MALQYKTMRITLAVNLCCPQYITHAILYFGNNSAMNSKGEHFKY